MQLLVSPQTLQSRQPSVLAEIVRPGVSICLWEREPPREVAQFLANYVKSQASLELDFVLKPEDLAATSSVIAKIFGNSPTDLVLQDWLNDIDFLVKQFREIAACSPVRVRLLRVIDTACSVFHVDHLSLRLLCTYHGAGTQWVPASEAQAAQLGLRGRSIKQANEAIVPNPGSIRSLSPWHVALIKGSGFAGDPESALIHRSHPQCCADHARIRLVIDVAR